MTFCDWIACVAPITSLPRDQARNDFAGIRAEIPRPPRRRERNVNHLGDGKGWVEARHKNNDASRLRCGAAIKQGAYGGADADLAQARHRRSSRTTLTTRAELDAEG